MIADIAIAQAKEEKIKILVVDDRPDNLKALQAVLDEPAYDIVKAHSGAAALKRLLTDDFAVILLDVQMPDLDGFETATLIRKRKRSRNIPIIFITAINKEESYVYKGYALGAVDYIFKPVEPDVLRAKVAVFADLFRKNLQIKQQADLLRRSERRERERQLTELRRRSERHYRNLADAVPQIIWAATPAGEIGYANRRWSDYTGLTLGQLGRVPLEQIVHPADVDASSRAWQRATASGEAVHFEARLRRGCDGAYRWHLVQVSPETDPDGAVSRWLCSATDIDDQKRSEQTLAAEKELLRVTLRAISDGVITADVQGRVVLMNRIAEAMTGWRLEEARHRPIDEVLCLQAAGREPPSKKVEHVLHSGEAVEVGVPIGLIPADGSRRMILENYAPVTEGDDRVAGVVIVFRDVTDNIRLEEERLKASKLESIGILAGALAHDFNNILTAILGNVSLAKLCLGDEQQASARLTDAERASLWAKDITQQLLTFSKGGAPVRKTTLLGDLVRDAAALASSGSNVRCEFRIAPDLLPAEVDEGQLRQVIHNLVLNAQQAMPQGGVVIVAAENIAIGRKVGLPLPAGKYVKLTCEDQGTGIPTEHLQKIFDPYFTTKQRGSGLGLATAYSIIKKHDGLITVESQVGRGSVFTIFLPASAKSVAHPAERGNGTLSPGQGRILVMDDEAYIRDLLERLFSHYGYQVVVTQDGAEVLSAYAEALRSQARFDVVIMDLVIPGGMGGREAIQKLLRLDSTAKVIVSSGYSNDPIMSNFRSYGFSEAVCKPYKNDELARVVQGLMQEKRAPVPLIQHYAS